MGGREGAQAVHTREQMAHVVDEQRAQCKRFPWSAFRARWHDVQTGIPLAGFAVTFVLLLAVRTFPGACIVVGGGVAEPVNRRRLWGGLVAAINGLDVVLMFWSKA